MANAETLRVVDPLEYNRAFLTKGVRPDGRALLRGRKAVPHGSPITSAEGSALLRLGETAVLVGVQCEPTAPAEMEPTQGRIVVGVDVAAVSSPASSAAALGGFGGGGGGGRLEREKAVLVEFLQRVASGGLIDLNSLCAVEGVAVWSLYCDVCVLQHDGNLLDASLMAMMLALSRVKLPSVKVAGSGDAGTEATAAGSDDGGPGLVVVAEEAIPVVLSAPLYPISFGLIADVMVCDPNADEEALISTSLTLLLDGKGEMVVTHKPGGAPLPEGSMEACLEAARRRLPALRALVQQ